MDTECVYASGTHVCRLSRVRIGIGVGKPEHDTNARTVDVVLHANLHAVVRETPRVHFYACKASLTLQMELGQSA